MDIAILQDVLFHSDRVYVSLVARDEVPGEVDEND